MWPAVHIAVKDLRLLARDRVALFWAFGFPVLFALFFGAVMRAGVDDETSPARLLFVDEAYTSAAQSLRQRLSAAQGVSVEDADLWQAEREVRRGAALALLRVPQGYGTGYRVRPARWSLRRTHRGAGTPNSSVGRSRPFSRSLRSPRSAYRHSSCASSLWSRRRLPTVGCWFCPLRCFGG